MKTRLTRLLAILLLITGSVAHAEDGLDKLSFLVGHWVQEGETRAEEIWMEPKAGTMVGAFRMVRGDKHLVSEFLIVRPVDGVVEYTFKHFRTDYTTWETADGPPLIFRLTDSGPGRASFSAHNPQEGQPDTLGYTVNDKGQLEIFVGAYDEDGKSVEGSFTLRMDKKG